MICADLDCFRTEKEDELKLISQSPDLNLVMLVVMN